MGCIFFFLNKLLFLYSAERQREGETIRGEPKAEKEVCKEEQKREIFPEELSTRLKPISKYSPFSPSLVCPKLDKYQFSNWSFHIFSDNWGKINIGTLGFTIISGRLELGVPRWPDRVPLCWVHSAVKYLRTTGMWEFPRPSSLLIPRASRCHCTWRSCYPSVVPFPKWRGHHDFLYDVFTTGNNDWLLTASLSRRGRRDWPSFSPLYRWRNQGTERWSELSMITVGTLNQPVIFPDLPGSKEKHLGSLQLKQISEPRSSLRIPEPGWGWRNRPKESI